MVPELRALLSTGGRAEAKRAGAWHLSIPEGPAASYRVAQIDDYSHLGRRSFRWQPPLKLHVRARVSGPALPGTWGFGLWNDPFTAQLGFGAGHRLPALPNAAWFFYASPPNYLALSDSHPAQGMLAATFSSPHVPSSLLALGAPVLALAILPWWARLLRRVGRHIVGDDAISLDLDPAVWHDYEVDWHRDHVAFRVDERPCFRTPISPRGPLGLVLWIDNQYMALPPDGRLRFGALAGPDAWLDLDRVGVEASGEA